jgi:hypothetical protein
MASLDKFQTKKTYERNVDPQSYVDPNVKYLNQDKIPAGMTFPSLSSAPKEYLMDPNAILPADRNPVDWQMTGESTGGDISTEERNQRALVRDYLAQKYGEAASSKGVEEAMARQKRGNDWADVGYNVDRMLMAHSAARGGPGADAGYYQSQKKDLAGDVQNQEELRQAKIKDYLTKQNMGEEGVKELQQMHGYDITNAQNDPHSNVSRSYQNAFETILPNEAKGMGGDIPNMSANEIQGIAKMYGAKAESELRRSVEMAKLGYADAGNQLRERQIGNEEAKVAGLAPKTQAEIDKIKADTALSNARTKAVQTGKPGAIGGGRELNRERGLEYKDGMVMSDAGGNYYDINKNPIVDLENIKEVDPTQKKAMTESQAKALSYWERADRANSAIEGLSTAKNYNLPSSGTKQIAIDAYLQSTGVKRMLAKKMLTPEDMEFANANMGFLNAVLRQDSGAAIPESEYAKYKPMLPEYGDNDEILAQKKAERESIIKSLGMAAGDRYTQELSKRRTPAPKKEGSKIPENSIPYNPEIYKALEFIKNPENKNNPYYDRTVEKLRRKGVIK